MLKQQGLIQTAGLVACAIAFATIGVKEVTAHHGWSQYNSEQTLNLKGAIREVNYGSPHVTIRLQTRDRVWLAVLAPPSRMQKRGLPQNALRVGATVSVVGYPNKGEAAELRAERITIGDKTVELR